METKQTRTMELNSRTNGEGGAALFVTIRTEGAELTGKQTAALVKILGDAANKAKKALGWDE